MAQDLVVWGSPRTFKVEHRFIGVGLRRSAWVERETSSRQRAAADDARGAYAAFSFACTVYLLNLPMPKTCGAEG